MTQYFATAIAGFLGLCDAHPLIAWSSLWLLWGPVAICGNLVLMGRRALRSLNIALRGWPPPHLDADGDFKKPPETAQPKDAKAA